MFRSAKDITSYNYSRHHQRLLDLTGASAQDQDQASSTINHHEVTVCGGNASRLGGRMAL